MDGRRLPHIDSERGTSAPSLQPLVAWFRTGFRCLSFAEAAAREVRILPVETCFGLLLVFLVLCYGLV